MTFYDNFTELDLDKWHVGYTDRPNPFTLPNPLEYYDQKSVVASSGLKLLIEHDPKEFQERDWYGPLAPEVTRTIPYRAGVIVAKNFQQRFGYYEVKAKMPSSPATWPAFWISGAMEWPPEIDIFEIYTSKSKSIIESNYHYGAWGEKCFGHKNHPKRHQTKTDLSKDFHVYAMEWDPCYIEWYFDGKRIRKARRNVRCVLERMNLILSVGIHPPHVNDLQVPTAMEVEYVLADVRRKKRYYFDWGSINIQVASISLGGR